LSEDSQKFVVQEIARHQSRLRGFVRCLLGRDHNHTGFTTSMAGGGVKGGIQYGATDDFGYEAVVDKLHIHDWHATILHLLGLDHERLTFRHAGRDMRLTDVKGRVHEGMFA
jgi:hypothetical protein